MKASVRPSWLGTMDESGNVWHGGEGEGNFNLCPHITVVKRKPEPIVAEFNDACCALSEVMMKLEYEKAAKYHKETDNFNHTGSYNAAMTTRLTEPWAKTNAAVYGDSRFGSVKAAYWNKKLYNTHSLFDIKTGTSLFPRKELLRLCAKEHGSILVMTASITTGLEGRTLKLFAIAQRRGPSVHSFLATFGTFNLEISARFPKITKLADAPYAMPSILNVITNAQPGIDKFNRTAFDVLGAHDTFVTRCYETRFSQHFMMPITYVNAVNAAKYFSPGAYHKSRSLFCLSSPARWCATTSGSSAAPRPRMGRPATPPAPRAPAPPTATPRTPRACRSTAARPRASRRASTPSSCSHRSRATPRASSSVATSATCRSRGPARAARPRTTSSRSTRRWRRAPS
jgi:hypothetical protein